MKIAALLVLILFFTVNTFALDTSTETGKTQKQDIERSKSLLDTSTETGKTQRQDFERSKSLKKSKEEKETGIDKQTQEKIKPMLIMILILMHKGYQN